MQYSEWVQPGTSSTPSFSARGSLGRSRRLPVEAILLSVLLATGCDEPLEGDAGAPLDAGAWLDAESESPVDGSASDAGTPDASPPEPDPPPPTSIFFVGNSFTSGQAIAARVAGLATYAGYPPPRVESRARGGWTLDSHRHDDSAEGAPSRIMEGWDAVVLQEYSTRPTDQIGPAEEFKVDATWFYDLAKSANPDCEVVLYETWARRSTHELYPDAFDDPAQMQAELRFHYNDAADRYIPANSTAERREDVRVAPVGDAWEAQLEMGEPPRLHAEDDYHAGPAGGYLNALVLFSTLYRQRTEGLVPMLGLDDETAAQLQATADRITGQTRTGPTIVPVPMESEVRVDFGTIAADGWTALMGGNTAFDIPTVEEAPSTARVTAHGFVGAHESGSSSNSLGFPAEVSRDTIWVGSLDGHEAALGMEARVVVRGLPPGRYDLELFASRAGDDGGAGRLARYTIGDTYRDLDASGNSGEVARFEGVSPDERGEIVIRVAVSPEGAARFAYLGALRVLYAGE